MSAYMLSRCHIDYLITAAAGPGRDHDGPLRWRAGSPAASHRLGRSGDDPTRVGRMLWAENWASVSYRYPDVLTGGSIPREAPDFTGPRELADYRNRPYYSGQMSPPPVKILKAIAGYEYQSCEHPGWDASEAAAFCEALRHRMIGYLPGWDEADTWSVE